MSGQPVPVEIEFDDYLFVIDAQGKAKVRGCDCSAHFNLENATKIANALTQWVQWKTQQKTNPEETDRNSSAAKLERYFKRKGV